MIKDILTYLFGKLTNHSYSCDRCQSLGMPQMTIRILDYIRNKNQNGRYCDFCWNWINLKHYSCECGNKSTLRSAHQKLITCMNCYKVVKCQ